MVFRKPASELLCVCNCNLKRLRDSEVCTLHFEYSSTPWPVARPQRFSYPSSLSLDIPFDGVIMAHRMSTGSRGKLLLPTLISALVIILSVALVVEYYTSNQKRPEIGRAHV